MELLKSTNLVLRFLLELCMLAALAYWGATTSLHLSARIAIAVGLPFVAAVIWAFSFRPEHPSILDRRCGWPSRW